MDNKNISFIMVLYKLGVGKLLNLTEIVILCFVSEGLFFVVTKQPDVLIPWMSWRLINNIIVICINNSAHRSFYNDQFIPIWVLYRLFQMIW